MTGPLLAFQSVTLRRGGRLLFEHLDLSVRPGEGLHVSGPNGVGKSSLIRLAAGLLEPHGGMVLQSRLSLADHSAALDPELPLQRALLFWCSLSRTADKLDTVLDKLGLSHLAGIPVRLLSTGQAKRATLARVAASSAPLWLLDEPLNGLDADGAHRLDRLLAEHRAAGGAVVAASHMPLPGEWTRMDLGR